MRPGLRPGHSFSLLLLSPVRVGHSTLELKVAPARLAPSPCFLGPRPQAPLGHQPRLGGREGRFRFLLPSRERRKGGRGVLGAGVEAHPMVSTLLMGKY